MFRSFTTLLLGVSIGLAGCTTLSRDECAGGDWHKIGFQDGNDGQPLDRFNRHVKACGRDGAPPNRALYLEGRQQGIAAYCTAVRGYREGALGQTYHGVCPSATATAFLNGFNLGRRIHQTEALASDIVDAELAVSRKLQQPSMSEAERTGLFQEQNRLKAEEARLAAELNDLRAQADALVAAARRKN